VRSPITRLTRNLPAPIRVVADWLITIAVALVFVLAFEAEIAKPYRIPSASMEPTLHCAGPGSGCRAGASDRVIALRLAYRLRDPKRGEIAVFKAPPAAAADCMTGAGGAFVKRLIGLPGDAVSERNGFVYVNGRRLDEPYISAAERDTRTESWPRLRPGEYFFLGDNRRDSCDSRTWGAVPRGNLIGPVVVTYWPLDRLTFR
jgi:signal peptidase I